MAEAARNVVQLPSASPSFVRVRKAGSLWSVDLETPCPGRALRTRLRRFMDREAAIAFATETADSLKRPVRFPKGCTA